VLLDRDLAELYGVETRALNQAVRRNLARFPPDFMIVLTRAEIRDISQIVTCSTIKHARSVSAFTEQGVAMLSSALKSDRAIAVNIEIRDVGAETPCRFRTGGLRDRSESPLVPLGPRPRRGPVPPGKGGPPGRDRSTSAGWTKQRGQARERDERESSHSPRAAQGTR
jgi:hypothetical protein